MNCRPICAYRRSAQRGLVWKKLRIRISKSSPWSCSTTWSRPMVAWVRPSRVSTRSPLSSLRVCRTSGKPVPEAPFRRAAKRFRCVELVEAVARGHEVDEQFVGRQAPPHDEEAEEPLPLGRVQGGSSRLRTISRMSLTRASKSGSKSPLSPSRPRRPTTFPGLEAEEESTFEFRHRGRLRGSADGGEAVLHLVAVVESGGGIDPAGVPGVEVGHPTNPAVDVQRGALFPLPLGLERQRDVRSAGNGLVGHVDFARCALEHGGDAGFRVASFAQETRARTRCPRMALGTKIRKSPSSARTLAMPLPP